MLLRLLWLSWSYQFQEDRIRGYLLVVLHPLRQIDLHVPEAILLLLSILPSPAAAPPISSHPTFGLWTSTSRMAEGCTSLSASSKSCFVILILFNISAGILGCSRLISGSILLSERIAVFLAQSFKVSTYKSMCHLCNRLEVDILSQGHATTMNQ